MANTELLRHAFCSSEMENVSFTYTHKWEKSSCCQLPLLLHEDKMAIHLSIMQLLPLPFDAVKLSFCRRARLYTF
ncbi:hypothetical protein FKM82_029627 [Ascaphus truei]